MSEIDRTNYESFRFWTPVTIRYSDQDSMGHVNNCAYAAYAEAGRTMFLDGLLDSEMHPGIDFILASVKIDYLKEIYYPGSVNIGTRILKLGTKSMTLGTGMFLDGEAVAIAESVNLFFDLQTRKTIPIPDDIHAQLEADPMQETCTP